MSCNECYIYVLRYFSHFFLAFQQLFLISGWYTVDLYFHFFLHCMFYSCVLQLIVTAKKHYNIYRCNLRVGWLALCYIILLALCFA